MKDFNDQCCENKTEVYFRIHYFKRWLKEYIKEKNLKENEVCVVSHRTIFKSFIADEFDFFYQPLNIKAIKNSELLPYKLD